MPKNLELKASLPDPHRTRRTLREISRYGGTLRQTDTYFHVPSGRLKLREEPGKTAALVYYKRIEGGGARWSNYEIIGVNDAKKMRDALSRALGVKVVVRKTRELYLFRRRARIHLDHIPGLGRFIELEVISDGDTRKTAEIHDELIKLLQIDRRNSIAVSYSDLVLAQQNAARRRGSLRRAANADSSKKRMKRAR